MQPVQIFFGNRHETDVSKLITQASDALDKRLASGLIDNYRAV
jgi:hypothetical protein